VVGPCSPRAQYRSGMSPGLERVRQAAKQRKKERFTALLHHITADLLRGACYALKRKAAPGIDGWRWSDYEANLDGNLQDLRSRVQRGAYRATYLVMLHGRPTQHRGKPWAYNSF